MYNQPKSLLYTAAVLALSSIGMHQNSVHVRIPTKSRGASSGRRTKRYRRQGGGRHDKTTAHLFFGKQVINHRP